LKTVYAESSAVLSLLFGEARGSQVKATLQKATFVVTSDLTLVECDRALIRAHSLGLLTDQRHSELSSVVQRLSKIWICLQLTDGILAGARRVFPEEPIRSLDALHLATLLAARDALVEVEVITLDDRVARNAKALGLRLALN
jgi:predicted nucleic acid-binding protein